MVKEGAGISRRPHSNAMGSWQKVSITFSLHENLSLLCLVRDRILVTNTACSLVAFVAWKNRLSDDHCLTDGLRLMCFFFEVLEML